MVALLLVANAGAAACGPSQDESPPLMGDCATCTGTPPAAGGTSPVDASRADAESGAEDADAQTFAPDGLDMVDVGLLSPEASDAIDMLPDALNFAH